MVRTPRGRAAQQERSPHSTCPRRRQRRFVLPGFAAVHCCGERRRALHLRVSILLALDEPPHVLLTLWPRPILTYERQACNKRGVKPLKHGIIYQHGKRPRMLAGEPQLGFEPVRVHLDVRSEQLVKESRVNYAKLTTIEHNFPVFFIGRIDSDDFQNIVRPAVDTCWQKKKHHNY